MTSQSRSALANYNGQEMPLEAVKIPALDRGFLFGDAVYEVIRVYGGRAWKLDAHLGRLASSMVAMQIEGADRDSIEARLEATLAHSGLSEAIIYIQVTRGEAQRRHTYPLVSKPNVLIYVEEFADPYVEQRNAGVAAILLPDIRWQRNDIKSTSLAANCLAAEQALRRGALEAILMDTQGYMTEGSHSSIFAVKDGNLIVAPSSAKVLPGITKSQILDLCLSTGTRIEERRLTEAEIFAADELFLTATPEEIIGIVSVNEKTIGTGKPGAVTRRLKEAFDQTVGDWLKQGAR